MNKYLGLILVIAGVLLAGCSAQKGDYIAASSLSKDGFARNGAEARKLHGQEVKLWGFVDHGNLYGDDGAKQILGRPVERGRAKRHDLALQPESESG